jgi:hypothetical protein
MDLYGEITSQIMDFFQGISDTLAQFGLPFGPTAWILIFYSIPIWLAIIYLIRRVRQGGGGSGGVPQGVKAIIASTGDVSAGMAGTKKVQFLKSPSEALVFLKIEENAIQQALAAVEYYVTKGELDESLKDKMVTLYQDRLTAVRAAIARDEELKELVDTTADVDRARSDYLRKLAAMSGTTVETEAEAGPPSVGPPSAAGTASPAGKTAAAPPSGGPPGGGPPAGGSPGGGPPSGGPPGGGPPAGGPPGGAPPSGGPPGGAPPSGGPPGGSPPSGGPPGGSPPGGGPSGGVPSGPPGGGVPSGPPSTPAGGAPTGAPAGGPKSSLQSEMLAEMERLKALMSGD